ncbi:MAG: UbiA family prenyltransferase [Chloroflexota bacterium]|jgi:4-hydroxybenzoate polyprenyltransferase
MQRPQTDRSDPTSVEPRGKRALLALAVVHPVPSALNAVLVAVLALVAGGERSVAVVLAIAMLGFQFSIGALNDVADVEADRPWKPRKPIPAGHVPIELAAAVVVLGALVGLGISATFGSVVLILGASGYVSGAAYDVVMRRVGLGWLCFAAAIPLLLAWTWQAAAATLPPGWPFLLPLAALAGPALHLANSLVDVDSDAQAERPSLATRLGPRRARATLATMMATILVLAWATLASVGAASSLTLVAAVVATITTGLGVALSWQEAHRSREAGWLLQAVGLATMATAWLASMV